MSKILENWSELHRELDQPYMHKVAGVVKQDEKVLQPSIGNVFRAFHMVSPQDVKVVILGQDPYPHDADGLCFSSPKMTPSLRIVFKEIAFSGEGTRTKTRLDDWAEQGVLLLNTVLTNRTGEIGAHLKIGWQQFTTKALSYLLTFYGDVVVMAWGAEAKKFLRDARLLTFDERVLQGHHPAAEARGAPYPFIGCGHFRRANDILISSGKTPIKWCD